MPRRGMAIGSFLKSRYLDNPPERVLDVQDGVLSDSRVNISGTLHAPSNLATGPFLKSGYFDNRPERVLDFVLPYTTIIWFQPQTALEACYYYVCTENSM